MQIWVRFRSDLQSIVNLPNLIVSTCAIEKNMWIWWTGLVSLVFNVKEEDVENNATDIWRANSSQWLLIKCTLWGCVYECNKGVDCICRVRAWSIVRWWWYCRFVYTEYEDPSFSGELPSSKNHHILPRTQLHAGR